MFSQFVLRHLASQFDSVLKTRLRNEILEMIFQRPRADDFATKTHAPVPENSAGLNQIRESFLLDQAARTQNGWFGRLVWPSRESVQIHAIVDSEDSPGHFAIKRRS